MHRRSLLTKALKITGTACLLFAAPQAFAGSEIHNGPETIFGNQTSSSSDIIIGPSANITINGDWFLTASQIYISPTATISGPGTIHLMSPTVHGDPAATTQIDGGGIAIGSRLSLENASGVSLAAIDPAVSYPLAGITDPGGAGTNNLRMNNNLNFGSPGAYLFLNNNNLIMNSGTPTFTYADLNTAGFTPDPNPGTPRQAYVVTNGSGVVTKQGLGSGVAFTFPVGASSATLPTEDYTPATVTNGPTAQDVNVAVKTYAGSAANEGFPQRGMDRSWMIYTSAGGAISTLALTHNTNTNGAQYEPTLAYITREWTSVGTWTTPYSAFWGGPVAPTGEAGNPATMTSTSNSYYNNVNVLGSTATNPLAANVWYSKASGAGIGINGIQVKVNLQGAMVASTITPALGTMRNELQTKGLLPTASTTAYPGDPLFTYTSINNAGGPAGAIVDWVRISLRDLATGATVLETYDYLLRTDGQVVALDGSTTLNFSTPPGNYQVSVQHRNHLGVMTALTSGGVALGAVPGSVDFTSAATPNYGTSAPAATNAQASNVVGSGERAMWAGNVEKTAVGGKQVIYYATTPSDVDLLRATVTNASGNVLHLTTFTGASVSNLYTVFDINLDGNIRYAVSPSDVDLARANVTNYPTNILHLTTFTNLIEQLP